MTELNFSNKLHGNHISSLPDSLVPVKLLKCDISKVAGITKITWITKMMKNKLYELVQRKLHWHNRVPEEICPKSESHFEMIEDNCIIKFNRVVIPGKAVSLDVNTINVADTTEKIASAAIYVRFKRRSSNYSCQLIFSRSILVFKVMSNDYIVQSKEH